MDVIRRRVKTGKKKKGMKVIPGTMMSLSYNGGGYCYIPFLRKYWNTHSCHFGESKKMNNGDDDCVVIYETVKRRKKQIRKRRQVCNSAVARLNGNNDDDDDDDCAIIYETITTTENKHDKAVQVSENEEEEQHEKNLQLGEEYFTKGLEPECIVQAIIRSDETKFLIKWKNASTMNWVSKEIANEKCPKIVADFFEAQKHP
uniref:Chromo domain-containing protein n=1 Tax=Setaria digitata TaxID=48799 RepID=A0A915PNW9_9BILA